MDPLFNPFTPGAGSQPPELVGRSSVLSAATTALARIKKRRHSRSILLYGLRGVGKTVLLNRIRKLADEAGYHTAPLEAPEERRLAELLAPPLRRLILQLDIGEGAKEKVRQALSALRAFASVFDVKIGDVGIGVKPAPGIADSGALDSDLGDLLAAVGEAAAERSAAVAILIDELQDVGERELAALLGGLHRVGQLNLPLVMFGAGLPQMVGLTGKAKSYAERLFDFMEIGPLGNADACKAIREPVEHEGAAIEDTALQEILAATEGYPYFLQEWGSHSWNQAAQSPITRADVIAATSRAIAALDKGFFRVRFDRLTPGERTYLRAMAELGRGSHRSGDIAAKLERAVEEVAPIRARIIAKGMAFASAHGHTDFTVPMFDAYMRRTIPEFIVPKKKKSKEKRPHDTQQLKSTRARRRK